MVASFSGQGYIVGGHDSKGYAQGVETFSISSFEGHLESIAQLRHPRVAPLVSCGAHGYLVVMGGRINHSGPETIIELIHQ